MFPSQNPMPRTITGLRTEDRLPRASESVSPDWQKWLDLVALAVAESQLPEWSGAVAVREHRPTDAPLLHGAAVRVPAVRALTYTARMAGELGIVAPEAVEPLALIRAGMERDPKRVEMLAGLLAVPADTVAVLGQLSAMPLLLNAAGTLSAESSRTWQRGYCPVCGAWPSMVEMRGIQRERRMRCGCCSSDWLLPVLRCAFCDEVHHRKLGSFANEGEEHLLRVETCASCHGYLKSITTLGALTFTALAAKDLSTVTFDLAASDRGFARPVRPGWRLVVEMES